MKPDFSIVVAATIALFITSPEIADGAPQRLQPLPQRFMARLHSKTTFVVFDWDENIFKLPTASVLFAKGEFASAANPRTFNISSPELSFFKTEIGEPGTPLERFELIGDDIDPMNGTFRYARPGGARNFMLEDMQAVVIENGALRSKVPDQAKAPFYDLFIARETKLETRVADRILTGRGQTREEFFDAVSLLSEVAEVKNQGFTAPETSRLTLVGGQGSASKLKAIDLVERLDEATRKGYKLFAFPDDDPMNIRRAAEALFQATRTIDVWLIWTRENGASRLIDLSKIEIDPRAKDASRALTAYLDNALDPGADARGSDGAHHERDRAALYCRSLFF